MWRVNRPALHRPMTHRRRTGDLAMLAEMYVERYGHRVRQCDMVANCLGVPTWIIPTAPFSASAKLCVTNA